MVEFEIKRLILSYFAQYKYLQAKGGAQNDGELYASVMEIEKQILKCFGLPRTNKYVKIMWQIADNVSNSKQRALIMMEQLSLEAEKYLASKPSSLKHLISEARKNHSDPFEVLPEIYVGPNSYTLFVYNEILLKGFNSDDDIIAEFQLIRESGCLMDIYMLTQMEQYKNSDSYKYLKTIGLKFIDDYMLWYFSKYKTKKQLPKIEQKSSKVEEALVLLIFAFKKFQKFRMRGYAEESARNLSGLNDEKLFQIARYAFSMNN
jgi:hypothetical protein